MASQPTAPTTDGTENAEERRRVAEAKLEQLLAKLNGSAAPAPAPPPPRQNSASQLRQAPGNPQPGVHTGTAPASENQANSQANNARGPSESTAPAARETNTSPQSDAPPGEGNRDELWRPQEPRTLQEAAVSETTVQEIILRFLLARGECEGRRIATQLQLPFRLVEPLLSRFKMEHLVVHKAASSAGDYIYSLTETGRDRASRVARDCTYYGAAPVNLEAYIESVRKQSMNGQRISKQQLSQAFADLLINPRMLERLGPAVNSGRGMFLFGYPGNGKTSIAERVTQSFGKYLWIPRALSVDGEIMRVYDPMCHVAAPLAGENGLLDHSGFDKRWIRIERPTIIAGGELTMDMLEVRRNQESNISEAPLQMKSNCGTLVIDDFGRQKMSVDQLLNRWIVPLEKRHDYLNMASGKKIQVPFDQLVIFSTNLEPKDLVDDAFLRRIPYKIEVPNPPEEDFRKLFQIMCRVMKIPYVPEPIDYLIKTHYKPVNRPFRNCQPRDLLLQVRNYCLYNGFAVELKNEYFDYAVDNYFSVM